MLDHHCFASELAPAPAAGRPSRGRRWEGAAATMRASTAHAFPCAVASRSSGAPTPPGRAMLKRLRQGLDGPRRLASDGGGDPALRERARARCGGSAPPKRPRRRASRPAGCSRRAVTVVACHRARLARRGNGAHPQPPSPAPPPRRKIQVILDDPGRRSPTWDCSARRGKR